MCIYALAKCVTVDARIRPFIQVDCKFDCTNFKFHPQNVQKQDAINYRWPSYEYH